MVQQLSPTDTESLIAQHVAPHPANPGLEEHWIARAGVSVWAIIGTLAANSDDQATVACLYHLDPAELDAALAFYRQHRALIDNRLAQNETD